MKSETQIGSGVLRDERGVCRKEETNKDTWRQGDELTSEPAKWIRGQLSEEGTNTRIENRFLPFQHFPTAGMVQRLLLNEQNVENMEEVLTALPAP